MATSTIGLNRVFPIHNADGTPFQNLVLHKATYDSVVMSLGDKITGDVYYKDNSLAVTMQEYIEYKRNPDDENELPVRFVLVNPPTIVREGIVSDNSELNGMTKYSFAFYHPMYMLTNFPFTDVAVESGEGRYLSENKTFSWTGTGLDFIAKINKNLQGTQWVVVPSKNVQSRTNLSLLPDKVIHVKSEEKEQSMVLSFDKNFVSDALKTAYDTWEVPFVIDALQQGEYTYTDAHNNVIDYYDEGKRFVVVFGLPNDEILDSNDTPYVFRYGQGVGLKNNSRTPKYNKIVTRIVGYGSEDNIPYGYPQIVWNGADDDPRLQYPIYKGIVGGQYVKLIKHPFTRKTLMPSIYAELVNKKVNPLATGYDPDTELKDYYDADNTYDNPINISSPSVTIHQFDIKPQLGQKTIAGVSAYDEEKADYITEADFRAFINTTVPTCSSLTQLHIGEMMDAYDLGESDKGGFVGGSQTYEWELAFDGDFCSVLYNSPDFYYKALVLVQGGSPAIEWDDTMNDDGEYVQSYFKLTLPNTLDFDLYACAAITQEMQINMRSGACIGCTFPVQVDWDDYKKNFYDEDGNFDPVIGEGHPRNAEKYPNSYHNSITVIVQKDIETFGRIMPNTYQQPNVDDEFVILGISLPQSYITNAQVELDNAMKDYMRGNNVYYYEYPLKFDEHFFATHTDILAQIRNNVKLRFGYGNNTLTLYVKQMSIKYGNAPLPQYDITLTDDVEVVMNTIGQVAEYAGRTRMQLDELQRTYGDDIVQRINEKLSRVADDVAEGRITFQQGLVAIGNVIFNDELRSPDFDSGLYSGKGWRIDKLGNAEMESLRVRSYLEVVELLINRLQAQEGDTVFTDNDQIEHVEEKEYNNTTYYVLSLKEKWEGYITSQQKDNILKGIINTLAANYGNVSDITEEQCVETDGINKYYTSWMKVIDPSDVGETLGRNQIAVILYEDTDTPANKNFPPCELMTVARWGCDADPDDETLTDGERQSIIRRQSVFSISTSDGRIAKLRGVRTPIMQNVNYGTTLGTIPDFIKQWSIYNRLSKSRDYLYAQGVIVSDFIKVDSVGDPITNYVDAGQWQNNTRYLHNAYNEQNAQWETNDVWHNGSYWRCLVTQPYNGVYYEPTDANNLYWQKLLTSGAPAPFYTEEWYAWSNDPSTTSASDEPTISGSWKSYIPAQGSYSYLWKKIVRWNWNSTLRIYVAGNPQYFRMSGTNGTSISVKGHVATTSNLPTTRNDGDAYVVDADGHLYMWSDEANKWLDIGLFQGENGKTYYTHIAWAQDVTYNQQTGEVISVVGFVTAKSPDDNWMGVLVNEDSGVDPREATSYTWTYTKGVAVVASIDNEMDGVQTSANGKVVSTTTVSTSIRIYSNGQLVTTGITAASATLCGVTSTPTISGGVVTYQWTIPTTYTFTNGKAEATLQVTYNNTPYPNTFTLMASMGSAAYKLIPSVNEIIKRKSGSFSPATFTCYCTSLSNGVTSENPTEAIMQYSYNGSTWTRFYSDTQFQSSTVFANNRDKLYLRLLVGSTVMDKQTLSLIEDGTDGADGADGDSIFQVQAFKYFSGTPSSSDKPTKTTNIWQSTTDFGNGWHNRPTKPASSGLSSVDYGEVAGWFANGIVTIPSPGDSGINIGTIYFTTSQADVDVEIEITSSSEANYDFGAIGKLDTTSLTGATASSIKSDNGTICSGKVSGDGSTILVTLSVASAGRHSVQIAYAKDSSSSSFNDNAVVQVVTSVDSPNDLAYCCMATVVNGTVSGSWSSPIPWQGDKGDGAKYIYLRGTGNNNPMPALFTSFNGTTANNVQITSRGLTLLLVNRSDLSIYSQTSYDVYGDGESTGIPQCNALASAINNASSAYFVCIVSFDAVRWNDNLVNALKSCGSGGVENQTPYRVPFAFIGYKGLGEGYAMQVQSGQGSTDAPAEITAYVANGALATTKSGQRGKVGRFFYYAGTFDGSDSTTTFVVSDAQAPYFYYNNNYWVYNPEINPSGGSTTMSAMGTPSSSSDNWEIMTNDFKYLITEAIFGQYAHFGSFIINGDWMISQHGAIYDTSGGFHTIDDNSSYSGYTYQNAYTLFDPDYPNSSKPSANNFVPNYAVDGKTGNTYQNAAYVRGEIHASSGKIGGFSIGANELTNDDWQAGIDIAADSKVVKIGENAKGTMNTENAIIRAENTKSGQQYNTALYLNAQNATYNYAFYGNGNGVLNGFMQGYKVHVLTLIGTTTYLNLNNGQVQAIASVGSDSDKTIYLPTLEDCRKTLGISVNDNTVNFSCCMTIINQSAIQNTTYNRDNVYVRGGSQAYTDEITNLTTRPVVLAQGDPKRVRIMNCTTCYVVITYISKRFIANYITTTW